MKTKAVISSMILLVIVCPLIIALMDNWGLFQTPYRKIVALYNLLCLVPTLAIYCIAVKSLRLGKAGLYLIVIALAVLMIWGGVLVTAALRGDFV
jgi:hypothetical protein